MRLFFLAFSSFGVPAVLAHENLNFRSAAAAADDDAPGFSNGVPFFPDESSPPVSVCAGGVLNSILASLDTNMEELKEILGGLKPPKRLLEARTSVGPFDRANAGFHETRNFDVVPTTLFSGFLVGAAQSLNHTMLRVLSEAEPPASGKTPAAKLMQLLTSNSFAYFATNLITYPAKPGGVIVARLRSPMKNLVDAFCATSEYAFTADITPETTVCSIINVVQAALACREPDEFKVDCAKATETPIKTYLPETCPNAPGGSINMDGFVSKFNFVDLRRPDDANVPKLPMELPASVIGEEGFMYFLLYRSTRVAASYTAVTYPCGNPKPAEDMLPGWMVEHVFTYTPTMFKPVTQWKTPETPLMVVSKPRTMTDDNQCQRVMTIRGTSSQYEWFVDLKTQHIEYKGTRIHYGFFQLSMSLLPQVLEYLGAVVRNGTPCENGMELIITGHSLGGALTNVLAALLAHSTLMPKIQLTPVSFAAPATFDEDGVEFFRTHVNGRNIVVDLDPIAAAPCTTNKFPRGHIRCNGVVDTGSGFVPYRATPGRIVIDLMEAAGGRMEMDDNMGTISLKVSEPQGLSVDLTIPPPLQLGVGHLCGYSCKLSKYCDATDGAGWECYRPDKKDAADGAICSAYMAPLQASFP